MVPDVITLPTRFAACCVLLLAGCCGRVDDALPELPYREGTSSRTSRPSGQMFAWITPSPRSPEASSEYFSPGVFEPRPDLDAFLRRWYSKHLSAMAEPPLAPLAQNGTEVYRFLYLRSFHHPLAVRAQRSSEGAVLVVKELDGIGGSHNPGSLIVDRQRRLDGAEWDELGRRLVTAGFWTLGEDEAPLGEDGAQWILEGGVSSKYHVVTRWSPGGLRLTDPRVLVTRRLQLSPHLYEDAGMV